MAKKKFKPKPQLQLHVVFPDGHDVSEADQTRLCRKLVKVCEVSFPQFEAVFVVQDQPKFVYYDYDEGTVFGEAYNLYAAAVEELDPRLTSVSIARLFI